MPKICIKVPLRIIFVYFTNISIKPEGNKVQTKPTDRNRNGGNTLIICYRYKKNIALTWLTSMKPKKTDLDKNKVKKKHR